MYKFKFLQKTTLCINPFTKLLVYTVIPQGRGCTLPTRTDITIVFRTQILFSESEKEEGWISSFAKKQETKEVTVKYTF